MELDTKAFGRITVDDRQQVHFPFGIFGFEEHHDYVLLDASQRPFYWLQSAEKTALAFVLINPQVFRPDYVLQVEQHELDEIGISDPEDVLSFAIVTIPDNVDAMTANLQGPIIINRRTHVGRQSISLDPQWQVRHSIFEEMHAVKQRIC